MSTPDNNEIDFITGIILSGFYGPRSIFPGRVAREVFRYLQEKEAVELQYDRLAQPI